MFKNSAIENKKKKDFLKKQRLNVINLRNKFLAEWASNILELNDKEKLTYIKKIANAYFQEEETMFQMIYLTIILILLIVYTYYSVPGEFINEYFYNMSWC